MTRILQDDYDTSMTEIGELPTEWSLKKIGDLFEIQQGKALSPNARRGSSPRPFLRTSNVLWGDVDVTNIDKMDFDKGEAEHYALRYGDLLVCEGGDIGRTAIWRDELTPCYYQNHIHRLRPKSEKTYPPFYVYWMDGAINVLGLYAGQGNRTTIPNLSKGKLSGFVVPVPPLDEQRQIAETLTTAREAQRSTRKVMSSAREFKQSVLEHLMTNGPREFGANHGESTKSSEIGPMPRHWDLSHLGNHAAMVTKGSSPRWQGFEYLEEGILFLRAQNVINGEISLSDKKFVSPEFNNTHKSSVLKEGDLLVTIAGTIGRAAVVPKELAGANTNQAIAVVRLRNSLNPRFAAYYLTSRSAQSQFGAVAKQLAQANLSLQDIKNAVVPVPQMEEQERIVSMLQTIDEKIGVELSALDTLLKMYRTLLHELLMGRIRFSSANAG